MDELTEAFLALLKYGSVKGATKPDLTGFDQWPALLKLAGRHNVTPVIYKALSEDPAGLPEGWEPLRKLVMVQCVRQARANQKLGAFARELGDAGLLMVVFKGRVLAELYRDPSTRISCDADILIREEDYAQVVKILAGQGFRYENQASQEKVKSFKSEELSVDLHLRIWGDITGKHIQVVEPLRIDDQGKLRNFHVGGVPVKTLGGQEHFLYLLVHFAKHFIIKGIGIRHLMDISLYYNAYRKEINTPELWRLLDEMNFASLCASVFTICCSYLGMNDGIFEGASAYPKAEATDLLFADILDAGVFGTTPERSVSFNVVKESYYLGVNRNRKGALWLHMIFPRPMALPAKYFYAKKHPILLPVAWLHRWCSYLVHRVMRQGNRVDLRKSLSMGDQRIRLLESLGLVAGGEEH